MQRSLWLVTLAACGRIGFDPTGGAGDGGPNDGDVVVPTGSKLVVGFGHACVLDPAGSLTCWGRNSSGELGDGATTESHLPTPGAPGRVWRDVAAGGSHSCAIDDAGRAWCWGSNDRGQLGTSPTTCGDAVLEPALGETCDDANTANGDGCSSVCTATTPPAETTPQPVNLAIPLLRIYAAFQQTYALAADGTLWAWGRNGSDELGLGDNVDRGRPAQVLIVAPQSGPDDGWIGVGPGDDHVCGRQLDGSLWCWGADGNGELGQGGPAAMRNRPEVVTSAGGGGWSASAAGRDFGCAIRTASALLGCWGRNDEYQLGVGDAADRNTPALVDANSYDRVGAGLVHACARRTDGTLWCWGLNTSGQLGLGTVTASEHTPMQVPGAWTEVAGGADFTCAIDSAGQVWCWGNGVNGRLGNGGTTDSSSPVRVGG